MTDARRNLLPCINTETAREVMGIALLNPSYAVPPDGLILETWRHLMAERGVETAGVADFVADHGRRRWRQT